MKSETLAIAEEAIAARDFGKAIAILEPLANTGDYEAQYLLGNLYFEGSDMPALTAYNWLTMAAAQDHADACFKLAVLKGYGDFVQAPERRQELLLKAATLGSVGAQVSLGCNYATGDWFGPGPLDLFESAKWYGRAALAGHADAQYELGLMLLFGQGIARDVNKGTSSLEAAARQKHEYAIRVLIDIYATGEFGCERDPDRANYWQAFARGLQSV